MKLVYEDEIFVPFVTAFRISWSASGASISTIRTPWRNWSSWSIRLREEEFASTSAP